MFPNVLSLKIYFRSFLILVCFEASIQGFGEFGGLSKEDALRLFEKATKVAVEAVEEFWAENKDKDPGMLELEFDTGPSTRAE